VAQGKIAQPLHDSIFLAQYAALAQPDEALNTKWARVREIREAVNKDIEVLRAAGQVGASLQAAVQISAPTADLALLRSLGADLKYALITSTVGLLEAEQLAVSTRAATAAKCERCWHYVEEPGLGVGSDPAHPTVCGRCVSNLFGAGESRQVA